MVHDRKKSKIRSKDNDAGEPGKISVILPCWNAAKTLPGAITSILSQTYENWELIICDDGSDDDTERVVSRFKDPRIQYHARPHLGIPATRNYGTSMARGAYCVVQDADDFSLPNRLERIAQKIQETGAAVIYHSAYISSWDARYQAPRRTYLRALPLDIPKLIESQYLPGWPAYKKSIWKKKPFREETRYAYDWMMLLDWALSGFKFEYIDEGLYEYVRYAGSASDRFEREGKRAKAFETIKEILYAEYNYRTSKL